MTNIVELKPSETSETPVKEMPHNIEAEQTLLGMLLVNNGHYGKVNEILLPEHFYEPVHQRIFEAVCKLIERGQIASPIVLKNQFDQDPALADLGGAKYLLQLAKASIQIDDARELAKGIRDLATRRALIGIGEEIVTTAYKHDVEASASHQIEMAEATLFALAEQGDVARAFVEIGSPVDNALLQAQSAMKSGKTIVGVSSGFSDMDNMTGGLINSDLIILAGRPSMGKTAFAMNLAANAAHYILNEKDEEKGTVGVFSLEMSAEQLAMRLLSMGTGISSSRIRRGDLTEEEFSRLIKRSKEVKELGMHIDDTPALTISAVRTRARRLKRRYNLRLLVVDYLQLLRGVSKKAAENRVNEISEITQGLKAIAKELNIPVIALSQLSRAVEQREDKRPQLSDLRESGSIEQDADIVMFIYRDEYYLMRKQPPESNADEHAKWQQQMEEVQNITEILISKHRNGPIGKVKLRFDNGTTTFNNLAVEFE